MHFGIREHAMSAAINGMSLTKVRPFGATFFVFTDYMRGGLRLSAIMGIPVIYVLTHDSLGVGEDGPTHQPIEHLAIARATPGLITLRPADANEVIEGWKVVMQLQHGPALLVLTRQAVPTLDRTRFAPASGVARGAYVLAENAGARPDVLLLATGSEVSLCVEAYRSACQGRNSGARCQHAVVGTFRQAGPGISRFRFAACGKGARIRGNGGNVRMGALRRHVRAQHRDAQLWGFRADQGAAEAFRLHGGKRCRRSKRTDTSGQVGRASACQGLRFAAE